MKIREIIEWIRERKVPILWTSGISLVVIFIIYSIISGNITPKTVNLIEQPLTFYSKFTFEIPEMTISSIKVPKKGLSIYTVKDENNNIKVEGILTTLNIATTKKNVTADTYYQWKTANNDTVTYDKPSQTVYVSLADTKEVFQDSTTFSADNLDGLLPRFVNEKIDSKYEYHDTNVSKQGSGYKIEGRKKINGYPVFQGENSKYYDYILLDKNFKLKEFKISIPTFNTSQFAQIKLVLPVNLAIAASNSTYPKNIFQGEIVGLTSSTKVYDSYFDTSLRASSMKANSVEIGYYFVNTTQQFLVPTYRIEGSGSVTYKGSDYVVPIVAITSAINPDNVYIPSNIKYAY